MLWFCLIGLLDISFVLMAFIWKQNTGWSHFFQCACHFAAVSVWKQMWYFNVFEYSFIDQRKCLNSIMLKVWLPEKLCRVMIYVIVYAYVFSRMCVHMAETEVEWEKRLVAAWKSLNLTNKVSTLQMKMSLLSCLSPNLPAFLCVD